MPMPLEPGQLAYAAVKAKADRLARHMADPQAPKACSVCLGEFAKNLLSEWLEHLPHLRSECHALFDACIGVLALRWTPDEIVPVSIRLRTNLRRCQVHKLDRGLRLRDPLMNFVSLLDFASDILRIALLHGAHAFADRAARAGKAFADKRGRWPARIEQLLPGGASMAVENLLAACELYLSDGPLDALITLLLVARPVVIPVLATDACRGQLVSILLKMLDPVGSRLKGHRALDTTCRMLEALLGGLGAFPGEGARVLAGHEADLLRALKPVLDPLADDDPILTGLISVCGELSALSSHAVPPRVARWCAEAKPRDCGARTAHQFCCKVLLLLASRACAGPGCTLSAAGGRAFLVCARCRVPRYCSRACQRADWRGEGRHAPHKVICGIFSATSARACSDGTRAQLEDAFAREEPHFGDAETDAVRQFLESFCCHVGAHLE